MREQHLDLFMFASGPLVRLSVNQRAGVVAGILVDVAWDLTLRHFRAASGFQRAALAIAFARSVQKCPAFVDPACGPKDFVSRAGVKIPVFVEAEVFA